MKKLIAIISVVIFMAGCAPSEIKDDANKSEGTVITYINSDDIGRIAIKITQPKDARYENGAPILVVVPTFFTDDSKGFAELEGIADYGFVEVSLLYPGISDEGASSDGEIDYGGENSMKALRDAIKFASGNIANTDGKKLDELIAANTTYENVGLYAFSHPGIIATNVMAIYGSELAGVDYFVGRENPTNDQLSALEVGQYVHLYEGDYESGMKNTLYDYQTDYTPQDLEIDYSSLRYDAEGNTPYFDLDGDEKVDILEDYVFGEKFPEMFGKRCYSVALTDALLDNGALTKETWPSDLATPEEAAEWWSIRETNDYYKLLKDSAPNLKIMLVFADLDHAQVAIDKPHIHQAYDGFHNKAGLWIRLNPDYSYVSELDEKIALKFAEHDANNEPEDWGIVTDEWAYKGSTRANTLVPIAGVLEMADRTDSENWNNNLEETLTTSSTSS